MIVEDGARIFLISDYYQWIIDIVLIIIEPPVHAHAIRLKRCFKAVIDFALTELQILLPIVIGTI